MDLLVGLVGLGVLWLACGIAAAGLYQRRGRSAEVGFWGGFLLGPIGVLLAWFAEPDSTVLEQKALGDGMRKCPSCAELVKAEASICRYCQRALPSAIETRETVSATEEPRSLPPGFYTTADGTERWWNGEKWAGREYRR